MSANDLPGERWRPIAGFEDAYEVSDLGRVRSLEREVEMAPVGRRPYLRVVPRKLLGSKCMRGRPRVALFGEGRRRLFFVADLVAEAFLGERPEGKLVLLRDGGPDNVAVGNLFYGDLADREAGKRRRGTTARGIRHGRTHLDDDDVRAIRAAAGRSPQHDLAVRFGVCEMTIRRIQQGRMWRHVLAEPNRAERPDHPGSSAPDPDAAEAMRAFHAHMNGVSDAVRRFEETLRRRETEAGVREGETVYDARRRNFEEAAAEAKLRDEARQGAGRQ